MYLAHSLTTFVTRFRFIYHYYFVYKVRDFMVLMTSNRYLKLRCYLIGQLPVLPCTQHHGAGLASDFPSATPAAVQ